LVMPRFTKWVLRSKTCLLSFRPSTPLNNKRRPNETQIVSRARRNLVQGVHRRLARSADAVFLFFPAVDRDACGWLRARQRRETHGDAHSQRRSHRREPAVDRPFLEHGVISDAGCTAKPGPA